MILNVSESYEKIVGLIPYMPLALFVRTSMTSSLSAVTHALVLMSVLTCHFIYSAIS